MARTPKKGGRKSEDSNGLVANKRSSGRIRKETDLFNTPVVEKRKHKPKSTPKKTATPKKVSSGKKSGGSAKKSAKRKRAKKSESPEEEDDEDYEVEKIVDHRIYDGHYVEYAVKWVGYPDETSWMTEYDLRDAPDHLANYKFSVTKKRDKAGDEYAIEEILAHRDVGKKRYYLVHWKGFNNEVSHTELEERELADAKDVLSAYKKSLNVKQPSKSATKRKKSGSKSKTKSKAARRSVTIEKEESDEDEEEEETVSNEVQQDSDNDDVEEEEDSPKRRRRSES